MDRYNEDFLFDDDQIETKIKEIELFNKQTIKLEEVYKTILSCIDLTTLEGTDNNHRIKNLCQKSYSFLTANNVCLNVFSVCVFPKFVPVARTLLNGKSIAIASVAGGFPAGQIPLSMKLQEVEYALDNGADEIDMVISRGTFLEENYNEVFDEIAQIKTLCKDKILKVILETGELNSVKNIYNASKIAIAAGADFLKTSTGKIQVGATPKAAFVMLSAIQEEYKKSGKKVGFKGSGGIREPQQAVVYYGLCKFFMGENFCKKESMRFGASQLADKLIDEINEIIE